MKYSETKQGRTFVIRLEDGDIIHEVLEQFAKKKNINRASVMALGGVDKGSRLIVGPREGRSKKIEPMEYNLPDVHEVTGTGTIFPDDEGTPILHMHLSCGRGNSTVTGCIRNGVKVWYVLEVVIQEFVDCKGIRELDPAMGFKLLTL